jgi:segregation and condensation protein B
MENLSNKIESLLFYQAEPIKIKKLSDILGVEENETEEALSVLKNSLENRGVKLIKNDGVVSLTTSPLNHEVIEKIKKDEQDKELSKAALEVLSIILYRGPMKRSEIDYIRGVNSQFSLRALLIKGLIEKETAKDDERTYIYRASIDLLSHMGLSEIGNLPEYEEVNSDINNFINSETEKENVEQ